LAPQRTTNKEKVRLLLEFGLCTLIFFAEKEFLLLVPPRSFLFANCHHTKLFLSTYPSSWWNQSCSEPYPSS